MGLLKAGWLISGELYGCNMTQALRWPIGQTGAAVLAAALFWSAPSSAQSSSGPLDFLGNIFNGGSSKAGPAATQPASTGGSAQPWSGEDGASGHPLMTASAIREAAA